MQHTVLESELASLGHEMYDQRTITFMDCLFTFFYYPGEREPFRYAIQRPEGNLIDVNQLANVPLQNSEQMEDQSTNAAEITIDIPATVPPMDNGGFGCRHCLFESFSREEVLGPFRGHRGDCPRYQPPLQNVEEVLEVPPNNELSISRNINDFQSDVYYEGQSFDLDELEELLDNDGVVDGLNPLSDLTDALSPRMSDIQCSVCQGTSFSENYQGDGICELCGEVDNYQPGPPFTTETLAEDEYVDIDEAALTDEYLLDNLGMDYTDLFENDESPEYMVLDFTEYLSETVRLPHELVMTVVPFLYSIAQIDLDEFEMPSDGDSFWDSNKVRLSPETFKNELTHRSMGRKLLKELGKESMNCAICQDTITSRKHTTILGCKHYFCKGCIKSWLTEACDTPTCPCCRMDTREMKSYSQIIKDEITSAKRAIFKPRRSSRLLKNIIY